MLHHLIGIMMFSVFKPFDDKYIMICISASTITSIFLYQLLLLLCGSDALQLPIGRINNLNRSKIDSDPDSVLYNEPILTQHVDDIFLSKLKDLYRHRITSSSQESAVVVLDIMASHLSHLPDDLRIERLDVHGMNKEELIMNGSRKATNGSLMVRNFNDNPSLEGFLDDEYDAVLCCVGVQYLQQAEHVFAEAQRVLRPGGCLIVSFSNRFFYQKALTGWIERGMKERARLVKDYMRAAGGYSPIEILGDGTSPLNQLLSLGGGSDPFVVVIGTKERY